LSSGWTYQQHHTHIPTPSAGLAKEEISVSANNVVFPTESSLSKMRYHVIFLPLKLCDVLLGQPYLWKSHVVYEYIPHSVIITLGRQLYRIPEVASPTAFSLIFTKKWSKVISQTKKFVFLVIHAHSKEKVVTTSLASTWILSLQQKKVEVIVEEYRDIFSSPTRVSTDYQFKHLIDMTPAAPLPNAPFYHHSLMENDEIGHHIQDLFQKGHIRPNSSPCEILIVLV
jgi:hypothetical protein